MNSNDRFWLKFRTPILISLTLTMASLVGCGDSNRAQLVGDWKVSVDDRLLDKVDSDEPPMADDQPPRMLLRFYGSGSLVTETHMGTIESRKEGSWTWTSYDVERRTAIVTCWVMGQETETEIQFLDDGTIELVPPNLAGLTRKMKFERH